MSVASSHQITKWSGPLNDAQITDLECHRAKGVIPNRRRISCFFFFVESWVIMISESSIMYSANLFDVTHRAHDVVAKLNQRQWRWFNLSTRSCVIHVTYTSPPGLCHDNWFWTILWERTHCLPRQTIRSIRNGPLYMWEGARVFVGCNFFYLCKKTIFYLVVNFRQCFVEEQKYQILPYA